MNFRYFLKKLTPLGAISDIFEIENMLMAVDPPRHTSKLAYLHQKRINFIEKVKIKVDPLVQT